MADHRMSIDDEWKTSGELLWTFLIDKEHLSRIVPFRRSIPIR
ncbi:unnamed protein product [Brassica oleracea var. botrytis]